MLLCVIACSRIALARRARAQALAFLKAFSKLQMCLVALAGCAGEEPRGEISPLMDFESGAAYAAPFPGDHLIAADGTVDLSSFPDPGGLPIVHAVIEQLHARATGFGTTSGVFFALSGSLDVGSLPDLHGSIGPSSGIVWIDADESSPEYLRRYPVTTAYTPEPGLFGAANLLSIVPLQGVPLRPRAIHAVALTTSLRTADGASLGRAASVELIARGLRPPGMSDHAMNSYQRALAALTSAGVAADEIVAFSALTTADPTAELVSLADHARTLGPPAPATPWVLTDLFDDYCVYESALDMPVYQRGEPPFQEAGGDIVFDAGEPQLDHHERARIVVTIPRRAMPASGWPTAVMIRTGGGGDRPLVDRGAHATAHGPSIEPGSGPAKGFARAGYAGVSVDGPHGGLRNVSGGDEQFLVFNIANPPAMRDNLRQSALEIALLPDVLAPVALDVSACPPPSTGPGPGNEARFDTDALALMGHSMGATIAPLTLAIEPRYSLAILSGAGGSWIENVVHKKSPVPVKPLAELLVGYPSRGLSLTTHDPFLNVFQWAGEPADPPPYARGLVREPRAGRAARHVLMLQGIVDTYILPPIANATSLALGLDLAGAALDEGHPELAAFMPLGEVLQYGGGSRIDLPASGNAGVTAVVVQHAEDGIEDGHEVAFQLGAPKRQYRCLLETLLSGTPRVVEPGGELDPCQ